MDLFPELAGLKYSLQHSDQYGLFSRISWPKILLAIFMINMDYFPELAGLKYSLQYSDQYGLFSRISWPKI